MSADTMPCGCLGHADYEELCRYPALDADRDEWKRKALERDLEVARERDRAEQAEASRAAEMVLRRAAESAMDQLRRERDAARLRYAESEQSAAAQASRLLDAVERAEADNAVLLRFARDVREVGHTGRWTNYIASEAVRLLAADHPGAARLEYVRALEAVRVAATSYLREMHTAGVADDAALSDACARADALKGKR